jgi:hypothetical protein
VKQLLALACCAGIFAVTVAAHAVAQQGYRSASPTPPQVRVDPPPPPPSTQQLYGKFGPSGPSSGPTGGPCGTVNRPPPSCPAGATCVAPAC